MLVVEAEVFYLGVIGGLGLKGSRTVLLLEWLDGGRLVNNPSRPSLYYSHRKSVCYL